MNDMKTITAPVENSTQEKTHLETKTKKTKKSILDTLKHMFHAPSVKNLGTLTSLEVMALTHAEKDLELFPFHMYKGKIKGSFEYKGKIPMMKKLTNITYVCKYCSYNTNIEKLNSHNDLINTIKTRGYILQNEIEKLKLAGFTMVIEDVPSVFIIAPKQSKEETERLELMAAPKDPIILIKKGENEYVPVHSWDNSEALNSKLAKFN